MKCFYCGVEAVEKLTNHIADFGDCIVIVRGVPSWVCGECGEVFYVNSVVERLDEIVKAARTAMTEVAVINYPAQRTA